MLLVPSSAPRRLSASGEILTSWPTHLLATPRLHLLLEIIILGDFSVILFLILVGIFLVSDATEKTWTDVHLVVFILGMLLTKLGLMCMFWHFSVHFLICVQNYEMSAHNLFVCACKIGPKIWVPTCPHHYYLAHPRASCYVPTTSIVMTHCLGVKESESRFFYATLASNVQVRS
jgi:hypothetical protein